MIKISCLVAHDHRSLTDGADDDARPPVNPTLQVWEIIATARAREPLRPARARSPDRAGHHDARMPTGYADLTMRLHASSPFTRDDVGDRSTALTMIACPFRCPIRLHLPPSRALNNESPDGFLSPYSRRNSNGLALTASISNLCPALRHSRFGLHTPRTCGA